jgi:hypothetical protein
MLKFFPFAIQRANSFELFTNEESSISYFSALISTAYCHKLEKKEFLAVLNIVTEVFKDKSKLAGRYKSIMMQLFANSFK